MEQSDNKRVISAQAVHLSVSDAAWPFAERHTIEIAALWERRSAENPYYFNGIVLMLSSYSLSQGCFSGHFLRTDFRSFLYWREGGHTDRAVRDTVASALIHSSDGCVLLCQQRAGHLNTGFTTPPGGFIDPRDVSADGTVDIARAVMREITEETGLGPSELRQAPGFVITLAGPLVSIAVPWRSDLAGNALVDIARRHIASEPEGEIERVLALPPQEACATLTLPDYARALLGATLSSKSSG